MESFFLAETIKYLYLLFDEDNFLHNSHTGRVVQTERGSCVVEGGCPSDYIPRHSTKEP